MKRLLLLSTKTLGWILALSLALCILVDLFCETRGLPSWAANYLRAALVDKGISLQTDNIRAGLARGICLEHARLRLNLHGMPLIITCHELQARPRIEDLLLGRIEVEQVTFQGGTATLFLGQAPAGGEPRASLGLERCAGQARRRLDGVTVLTVEGLAEKIGVNLEAELRGLGEARFGNHRPTAPGPAALPAVSAEARQRTTEEQLSRISALLKSCRLSERDAFLSGKVSVDVQHPEKATFDGAVGVSELVLGDLLVSRFKSALHYGDARVRLDGVTVVLGQGQTLVGDLVVDLAAGRLSGKMRGHVLPDTLWSLNPAARPGWMDKVQTLVPVDIAADLEPSPWSPAEWRLKAEIRGKSIALPGVAISQLAAAGRWDGRDLVLERWRLDLASGSGEVLEGKGVWHRADATVEGEANGRLSLSDRLQQTGATALRQALRQFEFPAPVAIAASLERSPLDWRRVRARATLTADSARLRGRRLAPVAATLSLSDAVLKLDRVTAGFPDGPEDALSVSATTDVGQALASGTWEVHTEVRAKAILEAAPAAAPAEPTAAVWRDAVLLRGAVLYTPTTGALDLTAEGTALPGRWYASALPYLGLPKNHIIRDIRCAADAPARLVLNVTRADERQPLRLTATAAAEGARYKDLEFRTVQGDVELTRTYLSFTTLRAVTAAGEELGLDLRIDFDPLAITIRNARVVGNPEVVATFIDNHNAKAIYRAVWKDFRWTADHAASFTLRQLAYREGLGGRDWKLTMDADLHAQQLSYGLLPLSQLDANVLLDLPGSVTVRTARLETDAAALEGSVTILTGDNPKCTFALRHVKGGQDPAHILRLLNPEWSAALGPLSFSPESMVDCRGSFYLSREPLLQVAGTLKAPYCDFRSMRVDSPVAQWRLSQSTVHWNLTSGRLFGGPVAVTGVYDVDTGQGTVAFRGDAMDFRQVATHYGMKVGEATQQGQLTAHCRLQILRGWAGRDLQVYGDGNLSLTQADIWRVPIFDPLGRLLDISFLSRLTGGKASSLGRITRLDADLGFIGDRVAVRTLTTDGTILSLRGRGEYCWETDRIYLSVTGQTLDNAGIVGWLFRPLSWAFFNAELTGTAKENQWRLANAFSKALPGGSGAEPGETPVPVPEP